MKYYKLFNLDHTDFSENQPEKWITFTENSTEMNNLKLTMLLIVLKWR